MDSRVRALYQIEPRPEGPGQARRPEVLPPEELDDLKLRVSELVTNGIAPGSERLLRRVRQPSGRIAGPPT